ncbi:MAG TPA: CDP-alcohol phosphatidyltransferase family protein [Tepidisphaeraceae bacterium]|nr:CDP-alcohol phosphatidyltransferase family protein [Tepidisphaeraceae bacterium]
MPASRRPIAALFRRTAEAAVRLCVAWGVHADVISLTSIFAAALAGACFFFAQSWPMLLIIGPLLCYVRLWLNMLDGMVALGSGKASRRGEVLNDLPDRLSDVVIFAGVAHSGFCHPLAGYWAAIFALMTAYVGTLGQAVAGRREFGGMMAKPFRMVMLHAGAWGTFLLMALGQPIALGPMTVLDWTCLLVIGGCVQTSIVRLRATLRRLRLDESSP